jgi:hypothetical protein
MISNFYKNFATNSKVMLFDCDGNLVIHRFQEIVSFSNTNAMDVNSEQISH